MSYGTNAPQGFQPNYSLTGATWQQQTSQYDILSTYGTSIYTGDPVVTLASGGIGIGVAGAGILGVFQGCIFQASNGTQTYLPYWVGGTVTFGSQNAQALVMDDPNVEFNIQAGTSNSGTHTATVLQTDIGLNANFVIAAGSTASGISATFLDMATVSNITTTLSCKILRLAAIPGNVYGLLFNNAIVLFNNHQLKGGTGTVGT